MADERIYEQRLTNAIINWQREQQRASKFITAADRQLTILASIKGRISALIGISVSDASTYINHTTGQFKGGKYMPHCLDSQLKQMFTQLEEVTKVINSSPYHTGAEAETAVKNKSNKMAQEIEEIKRVFELNKAREIVARAKATAIKTTGIAFADNEIELEGTSSVIDLDEGKKSAFAGIGSEEQGMSM